MKSISLILSLILIVSIVTGCAVVKNFQTDWEFNNARAPDLQDSSPDTTGLLIIDAILTYEGSLSWGSEQTFDIRRVAIIDEASRNDLIITKTIDEIGVFNGLREGTYRVVIIRGSSSSQEATITIPREIGGSIEVKEGELTYFGQLVIKSSQEIFSSVDTDYEWKIDANIEIAAWEKVQDEYPDSPWIRQGRSDQDSSPCARQPRSHARTPAASRHMRRLPRALGVRSSNRRPGLPWCRST